MKNVVLFRNGLGSPFRLFDELEREMRKGFPLLSNLPEIGDEVFAPQFHVNEKEAHYVLSFDLPGVAKEDINLEVSDGKLYVRGERKDEFREGDYSRRSFGKFERQISLPKGIRESAIEAHYENGVLSLAIPKEQKSEVQRIVISDDKKEGVWKRLLGKTKEKAIESSNE